MNQRQLTCIGCPMGCQLTATLEGGVVTAVTGNTCIRAHSGRGAQGEGLSGGSRSEHRSGPAAHCRRGCGYPRCVRHRRLCSGHQECKISILYIVNILLPVV